MPDLVWDKRQLFLQFHSNTRAAELGSLGPAGVWLIFIFVLVSGQPREKSMLLEGELLRISLIIIRLLFVLLWGVCPRTAPGGHRSGRLCYSWKS